MNNLYAYIASMKGETAELEIVSHSSVDKSYIDQDVTVDCKESIFIFSDGVVIKYCTESDVIETNETSCPEYWITYEVLSKPENMKISPKRKTFNNQCQEAFWIKSISNISVHSNTLVLAPSGKDLYSECPSPIV